MLKLSVHASAAGVTVVRDAISWLSVNFGQRFASSQASSAALLRSREEDVAAREAQLSRRDADVAARASELYH